MTDTAKYIEIWKKNSILLALQNIKDEQARSFVEYLNALELPFQLAKASSTKTTTSGLVEQQRLFSMMRK